MYGSALDSRLAGQLSITLFTQDFTRRLSHHQANAEGTVCSFHNGSYYGLVKPVTVFEIIEAHQGIVTIN